jgi:hypothetical protein
MRTLAFPKDCVIMRSAGDVSMTLKQVNIHKETDYQDVYCEHALTNWQASSFTFSTFPCPSL